MTDKTQDPIASATERFHDLLLEAAQTCQDAPAVERQQAEAEAELGAVEGLLAAFDATMQQVGRFAKHHHIERYEQALSEVEHAREEAAALAEAEGNKPLAKACRAVAEACRRADSFLHLSKTARAQTSTEQNALVQTAKAQTMDAYQKALALLKSVRAHARVRVAKTSRQCAEIAEWKRRQTDLQASIHALATLARIRGAAE